MARAAPAGRGGDYAAVILAYGDSPFLEGCLASWAAQSRPVRLLVATSTPSPFIDAVAARFGVPVAVNPAGGGIAQDWNFGLTAGNARYVTLAHQDDVYDPKFAEATLAAFAAAPNAAACFTRYQEIDDAGAPTASKISRIKGLIESTILGSRTTVRGARMRAYLSFGNPLPCSSVTFDRTRLPDFAFSTDLKSNLDWDAWLTLCQQGVTFARVPARLVGRRHNELTETSRLIKSGRRGEEDLLMFRRLWPTPLAQLIAMAYRAGY